MGVQCRVDVLGESGSDHHYPLEESVVGRAKDQQLYYTFGLRVLLPVCLEEHVRAKESLKEKSDHRRCTYTLTDTLCYLLYVLRVAN